MWTVFRRCYGLDEDMCEIGERDYFTFKAEAEAVAKELEECYADDGWDGHPYYKSKFYAWEVTKSYIESVNHRWAMQKANAV